MVRVGGMRADRVGDRGLGEGGEAVRHGPANQLARQCLGYRGIVASQDEAD